MAFICPLPSEITDIPSNACSVRWDQIAKLALQRAGTAFANTTAIQTLSNWTTLLAASDDTKVQVTPYVSNLVIPQSEAQYFGGNTNETIRGIQEYLGENFVTVTGTFRGISPAQAEALRTYSSESAAAGGISDLVAYFFTSKPSGGAGGYIIHNALNGFRIYNFRVSTVGTEGFNAPNVYNFTFDLEPTWDSAAIETLALFNPLTAL